MSSFAADSTIVKKWREHPPFSYSLKINSFSQFSLDKYESRRFLSSGYNWRLVVYPKGNEKDNGSGFISMYVELDNTSIVSTPPTEVFISCSPSTIRKKTNTSLYKVHVEVKRFNAFRTMWGISQVISLETFNDPENGYIFEGEQCEFGVDVMAASSSFTQWEVVSFNEKLSFPKFSWSVKDFSLLKEDFYVSNSFSMGGREWTLKLYPKGDQRADGKWLSIYLQLADSETLMADEKIYVLAHPRVLDPRGSNHHTEKINICYTESEKAWGRTQFLSLAKLWEAYLDLEDALNVQIEFEVVSVTKHSA